jgi:hypothetical protein
VEAGLHTLWRCPECRYIWPWEQEAGTPICPAGCSDGDVRMKPWYVKDARPPRRPKNVIDLPTADEVRGILKR